MARVFSWSPLRKTARRRGSDSAPRLWTVPSLQAWSWGQLGADNLARACRTIGLPGLTLPGKGPRAVKGRWTSAHIVWCGRWAMGMAGARKLEEVLGCGSQQPWPPGAWTGWAEEHVRGDTRCLWCVSKRTRAGGRVGQELWMAHRRDSGRNTAGGDRRQPKGTSSLSANSIPGGNSWIVWGPCPRPTRLPYRRHRCLGGEKLPKQETFPSCRCWDTSSLISPAANKECSWTGGRLPGGSETPWPEG